MNCLECRRLLLVEPRTRTPALADHLRHCPTCARLAARQARFEQRLDSALRLPVPEQLADRVRLETSLHRKRPGRRIAIAAAIAALSAGLGFGGWEYQNSRDLAGAIQAQMQRLPSSTTTTPGLSDPRLDRLTAELRDYLQSAHMGRIVSVQQSRVRGRPAAYLRIANGDDHAEVFLLPDAWLAFEHDVHGRGMPGKLIPTDDGVIAVFCPDRWMLARVARDLRDRSRWRG